MTLLFRLLQRIPAVRHLQNERDDLLAEQNSARLKLRAASAEMGVIEEQCRVLQRERDQLTAAMARQAEEHASLLKVKLAENAALAKQCIDLNEERRALIAQRDATVTESNQVAHAQDSTSATAGSAEAAR